MINPKIVFATLIGPGLAACGHGPADSAPLQQPVDEKVKIPADVRPAHAAAPDLIGDWELRSIPPQRRPGIQLTVTVDSVSSTQYFGRLSHYFSGDVGVDPLDFEPFTDSIRPDRSMVITMPTRDVEMLGIAMEGTHTSDTVRLGVFVLGPDTLSNANRRWILVRKR